jgi:3-hydroxyisobutyrate dehydrogenase
MAFKKVEPGVTRIGWIGTGVMGRWMCEHILKAGYTARVFNRSPVKALPLLSLGAKLADSPKEVAANSDVIFSIVGMPHDVREVMLGEHGAFAGAKPGAILVDMTTSEPALAVEIAEQATRRGMTALDAPVTGGDVGAKAGTLSIMIGGDAEAAVAIRPLLECTGKTIIHHGGPGCGQHAKMVNQILISSNMVAICEALLYGVRAGLKMEEVLKSVSIGAAGSKALEVLGPRILSGNFEPGFYVEHFIKDMGIALAEAHKMKIGLPGLALAKQLYEIVRARGYGRKGTHVLFQALQEINAGGSSAG